MRNAKTYLPNSAMSPPDCIDGDSLATHHSVPPADAPPLVPPRQDVLSCQVNGSGKRSSFKIQQYQFKENIVIFQQSKARSKLKSILVIVWSYFGLNLPYAILLVAESVGHITRVSLGMRWPLWFEPLNKLDTELREDFTWVCAGPRIWFLWNLFLSLLNCSPWLACASKF